MKIQGSSVFPSGFGLGRHVTDPYSDVDLKGYAEKVTPTKIACTVKKSLALVRTEGSRLAYVKGKKGEIAFYVNGDRENLSGKAALLAQELANRGRWFISDYKGTKVKAAGKPEGKILIA